MHLRLTSTGWAVDCRTPDTESLMLEFPEQIVQVALQGRRYGLALDQVARVVPIASLRPVPRSPRSLLGLLDLHQSSIPVLDLPNLLGLEQHEPFTVDAAIVIVTLPGGTTGLLVDDVIGVTRVAPADWQCHRKLAVGDQASWAVTHTRDGLLMLLDTAALVTRFEGAGNLS